MVILFFVVAIWLLLGWRLERVRRERDDCRRFIESLGYAKRGSKWDDWF